MENIQITFKIFKGRNFHPFPEKWVNSYYKISAKTVFRTFHGNRFPQKGIFFEEYENLTTENAGFSYLYLIPDSMAQAFSISSIPNF